MSMPNILMIMTDQQRYDSLGCYGFEHGHTPHLDRLAAQSIVFEHCYVNNPVCSPSRASIMTGKPLPGHGVYRLHDLMPEDERFFPQLLREKGYRTALFGKLHAGAREYEAFRRHPHDGFDIYENALSPSTGLNREDALNGSYALWLKQKDPEFYSKFQNEGRRLRHFPAELHYSKWAVDRTIAFVEQSATRQEPFFCCMSLFDPHDPYNDYPLEALSMLESAKLPARAPGYEAGADAPGGDRPRTEEPGANMLRTVASGMEPDAVRRERRHHYLGDFHAYREEQIEQLRTGYHASIAFLDQQTGRVLEALEQRGLAERTLVLFVSDHGDMLGDRGLLAKGAFFYDPCTRVPLIIRPPGSREGRRAPRLVQPHDIAATLLACAGYTRDELDGIMPDSLDLLADDAGRDYAVCMYHNSGIDDDKLYFDPPIHATMYRERRYKLNVFHRPDGTASQHQGELFDMLEDPGEQHNLWNEERFQQIKCALLLKLMDYMVNADASYNGSRAGEQFPDKSQWSENNAL